MLKQGFGIGADGGQAQDFERLARQYWAAWGDALRGAAPGGGQAGAHAWQDAIDWWTRYAHGTRTGINDALERFNTQARDWYGHMQQVAARFAGRDHSAGDIARAWKEALGAAGANPFPEMLRSMRGHGMAGLDQWVEDARPWLDAVRGEGMAWLRTPAFGFTREHQERWQDLSRALLEYEECSSAYNALMAKASQRAFILFEDKLAAHEEPGRQIETPRALFDLWIDAAEEAYAEIALSPEFRRAYGELVDAQMRVRAGLQREVEQACSTLGMPTRTEVDAAHRKIVELERAVRRLRDAAEAAPAPAAPAAGAGPGRVAGKPAAKARSTGKQSRGTAGTDTTAAAGGSPARGKAGPAAPAKRGKAPPKRAARKLAPRPSVSARRTPTNGFSSQIPIPDAPLPPEPVPAARRGGR